jgi:4-amino-4-deoxy-L-arabinose transferase-like glycosyltransferase
LVSLPASKTIGAARRLWPQGGALLCVLTACALFLFIDRPPLPIQLWDESRVVVNALEMHARGFSLITTYGWRPDLWNTKPPLLIWTMAASLSVFGVSEFTLRLPTTVAALGILSLVFGFTRRLSGSNWTASFATVLLTLSAGFFGEHAARTADYDVPLSLFVTGYAYVLFFLLHRRRPGPFRVALATLLIAAATLTKGIAGLTPGAGVVAYLLIVGRWRRALTTPYLALGLASAAPVAAFLVAREQAAPGYLHASLFNDVAGRFSRSLDQHGGAPWAYLNICFGRGLFSCGWAAAAAPFALIIAKGRVRLGLMFSLCMAAGILGADSLAATKLFQYAVPAYPFLAIACALAVHATLQDLAKRQYDWARYGTLACALSLLSIISARSLALRYIYVPQAMYQPQAKYGELFASLSRLGAKHVRAIDDGVWGPGIPKDYMPQLRAEILIWRPLGLDVGRARNLSEALATPDSYTVTCDPSLIGALRHLGRDVGAVSDCIALPPHPR